jgi:hypothetical protein
VTISARPATTDSVSQIQLVREYCRVHSSRHRAAVSCNTPVLHAAGGCGKKGGKKERIGAYARDDDVHIDDLKEVRQRAV